jgi:3-hydroxyisobutyrate dehydrogenase
MFNIRAPMMADRRFEPAPGPFTALEKYLHLASEMAGETGSAMPLFSAAAPYFRRAVDQGIGQKDISAVITLLEQESRNA